MTYPPGNPGYQHAQPSGAYGPANRSFVKSEDSASKLPSYLLIAVVVLGFATYLASYGPVLTPRDGEFPFQADVGYPVPLAVLAALLAAAGLLPKAKNFTPIVVAIAVMGALLAIQATIITDGMVAIGWGLWMILAFTVLQAGAAVGALLLEAGVLTAPVPRPKYDPYAQYGLPPGSGYYGQQGQQGQQGGHQGFGNPQAQQQSGYPSYGGYQSGPSTGGYHPQSAPSTGGFGTGPQSASQGPPTPPTGFPSFSQPPAGGSGGSATGGQSGPISQSPSASQPPSAPSGPNQP
ncbi:MAG: DUF5336 domain-containing protein [Mycobacterium sp.]